MGIEAQAREAIARITAILAESELGLDDIVELTTYLTDPADVEGFMPVAAELMPQPRSAITALVLPFLSSPEQLVEIEAIAAGRSVWHDRAGDHHAPRSCCPAAARRPRALADAGGRRGR